MYNLAYWLHIISYIIWLLAFAASLWYGQKIRSEEDAIAKRNLMRSERLTTSIGTRIGVLGILISGFIMTAGPQWEWFNFQLHPWLALKQILFLVILVLVGIAMKRSIAFKKRLKQEDDVPSTDASDKWRSAYRMSMAVYILVVVNTILGLTKPLLG